MPLPDWVYDVLRYVANYVLPGIGTLYFALSQIWGLPYGEQIVGTMTAFVAFTNVLLGISNSTYNKVNALQNELDLLKSENKDP